MEKYRALRILNELKEQGITLNRKQHRSILNKNRHRPAYTKKFSTERGKTRAEKKAIQHSEKLKRIAMYKEEAER